METSTLGGRGSARFWGIGFVACTALGVSLIAFSYIAKTAGDTRASNDSLRTEIEQLSATLRVLAPLQERASSQGSDCGDQAEWSATLQALREDIALLAHTVGEVNLALQKVSAGRSRPGDSTALAPDFQPLPVPRAPRLGADPQRMMEWRSEVPAETRAYVEAVIRDHAQRARQQIAAQSADLTRPDLEVVSRVMEESQDAIAQDLRDVLPQEDFEALFPSDPGTGLPGEDKPQ